MSAFQGVGRKLGEAGEDEDYEHGNSDLETDHRYELDWEPDEDDVKAELDELIAEEAEEDENLDTSEGYELEDDDGTVKTVTLLPSSTQGPITAAEHNLLEKLRSKTEFKESLVRGLIRFNHVIDRAKATAALGSDYNNNNNNTISNSQWDEEFDDKASKAHIPCLNGIWISTRGRTKSGLPELRRLTKRELATMGFENKCICSVCVNQKEFSNYYSMRVDEDRATGLTRSQTSFKADSGRHLGGDGV